MRQNRLITIMAAFLAVCMAVGSAWAIDRVEVKVTSEPIPKVAQCSKAGGFSLEFDSETTLTHDDTIKIDLPNFFNGTQVTLCKDIDFVVSNGGGASYTDHDNNSATPKVWQLNGTGWTGDGSVLGTVVPQQTSGVENPFVFPATAGGNAAPISAGAGIIFHVTGSKGSDRITIKVIGDEVDAAGTGTLQVNTDGDAKLILKLFDLKDNDGEVGIPAFANPGIYEAVGTDGVYNDSLDGNDNVLCIDVFGTATNEDAESPKGDTTVFLANMDSDDSAGNDKFTFIPSNPQIAHIAGSTGFSILECKKVKSLDTPRDQEDARCDFDYDGYYDITEQATVGNDTNNQLIIEGNFEENTSYGIRLQITNPSNAYWGAALTDYKALNLDGSTCGSVTLNNSTQFTNSIAYKSNLSTAIASFAGSTCSVAAEQQAKYLVSTGATLQAEAKNRLWINIPKIVFDGTVQEGDRIEIKVTLMKEPCGEIDLGTVTLATFGASDDTLLFPYFTNMSGDTWWDGIAITNLDETAGPATLYVYEQDGDKGEATVQVKGHSMYIAILETIGFTLTESGSEATSGTLGDAPCYIKVETEFNADGFAMMGENTTPWAQGYLPRDIVDNDDPKSKHGGEAF